MKFHSAAKDNKDWSCLSVKNLWSEVIKTPEQLDQG